MRAIFVTGTDTGVGKTRIACSLARSLREAGLTVGVMKPVETGCAEGPDGGLVPADALALIEASGTADGLDAVNPYRFAPPVSPHIAAGEAGVEIEAPRIAGLLSDISGRHDFTIIEGAGGLMVPLAPGFVTADLAAILGTPLLVVAANRLGVLNHTLLTVECARKRGLRVRAVAVNNPAPADPADSSRPTNAEEVGRLTAAPTVEVPFGTDTPGFTEAVDELAGLFRGASK